MRPQVVAHRSDAVLTSTPGSAARDAVSRTIARKQSVHNATKMLGTFAARMGSMAQGLVAQPGTGITTASAAITAGTTGTRHTRNVTPCLFAGLSSVSF
jgi:hypothetical protein